ncbi:MAG: acyltransferase [Ruminococcaceae bacterium]|nr:acyltransferase [Oscillospiraceae bacterium]
MEKRRNGEIDLLRFVFSLFIVIFHFNEIYNHNVFSKGSIFVEYFFLVMGYLMASHVKRRSYPEAMSSGQIANETWRFTYNKIKVIFPYYVSAVIGHIIIRHIIVHRMSFHDTVVGLLRSIPTFTLTFLGLLPERDTQFYVGNTWFLAAMVFAILILYPMLLKSYDFSLKIVFPFISMISLGYLYATKGTLLIWDGWTGFCYEGAIRGIAEISLGAVLFCLSELLTERFKKVITSKNIVLKSILTLIKAGFFAILVIYAFGYDLGPNYSIHALLITAIAVLLSFSDVGYSIPDSKVTRFLGKLALPIFIFHGFMRWTFHDIYPAEAVTVKMFIFMIVVSIAFSLVMMCLTDLIMKGLKALGKTISKHI